MIISPSDIKGQKPQHWQNFLQKAATYLLEVDLQRNHKKKIGDYTWNSLKINEMDESVAMEDSISSFRAFIWYESEEHMKKSSKYGAKREGIALAKTWMLQSTCKSQLI